MLFAVVALTCALEAQQSVDCEQHTLVTNQEFMQCTYQLHALAGRMDRVLRATGGKYVFGGAFRALEWSRAYDV